MGALHINGQKATGVNITLADGVFIDADNLIDQGTFTGTMSYTATEDCAFIGGISQAPATPGSVEIDGVSVYSGYMTGSTSYVHNATFLLKAGQTITLTSTQAGWSNSYAVYGIQQGTIEGKLQPVIYSLEEREVGVWTNGKPLYQKTLTFTTSSSSGWTDVQHEISNIDEIIDIQGVIDGYTAGTNAGGGIAFAGNSTYISAFNNVSTLYNKSVKVTIQYTKTTDTAGAGTWTPDGVYAHHYSTDEKVVGTWIDGSTIYEITTDMGTAGVSIGAGASVNSNIPVGNIDKIVYSMAISQSGKYFPVIGAEQGDTYIKMINMGGSNRNVRWFTIQYTKSS